MRSAVASSFSELSKPDPSKPALLLVYDPGSRSSNRTCALTPPYMGAT